MEIKEFIEKVNEHDGMRAKKVYKRIAIGTPNNMGIFSIPEDATNFIEIDTWATSNSLYWKKEDREYLSALIEEFLHTPVEERFPEKKYRLVANPNSLEQTGTYATKYVACIQDGMDCFSFVYGGPTVFSEKELKQIEELHPNIAPAIDTMKEEVKDVEAD